MMGVSDVSYRQMCCQVRAIRPLRVLFGLSAIRALGNVWSSRLHYSWRDHVSRHRDGCMVSRILPKFKLRRLLRKGGGMT